MIEEQIGENLRKCPHFDKCNQNLCPLDFDLHLRVGSEKDKCRWMRERQAGLRKFKDKSGVEHKFYSSGSPVMPEWLLKYVPKKNIKWLNESSRKKWHRLQSNKI